MLLGVVGFAPLAFEAKPVVLGGAFDGAVVAVDIGSCVAVFFRHGLRVDLAVQTAELRLHVHHALAAHGAFVGGAAPVFEARVVDAVAAAHEDYGSRRGKEVVAADWAVAFRASFYAAVCGLDADAHADGAGLAVEEVST